MVVLPHPLPNFTPPPPVLLRSSSRRPSHLSQLFDCGSAVEEEEDEAEEE